MFSFFKPKAAITIDGKKMALEPGMTILEIARKAGVEIPTLCHLKGHPPTGVCRVCVVEVEGARTLAGACHTPAADGMVVRTKTPKVLAARAAAVELMLAAHTGDCVLDPNAENCKLHGLASDRQVGAPRFKIARPRFYPIEDQNPYVIRDLKKCIMCRRCITACNRIAGKRVLSIGYRGFKSKIITGMDEALVTEECRDCGACIEQCPTGALSGKTGPRMNSVQLRPANRKEALPRLIKEVADKGFISREALEEESRRSGLSVGEVYGVASFYSFLPIGTRAEHHIRVCQCVPCEMKDAATILGTIKSELGIAMGEITADGKFALEVVGCIGACDQAPAIMIDERLCGNLTAGSLKSILKEY